MCGAKVLRSAKQSIFRLRVTGTRSEGKYSVQKRIDAAEMCGGRAEER